MTIHRNTHMTNGRVDDLAATIRSLHDTSQRAEEAPRRPRLEFRKSRYPSFGVAEAYADESGNEVRITAWPEGRTASMKYSTAGAFTRSAGIVAV